MFERIKAWCSRSVVRCHACTFAMSLSFNSIWRVPRECILYGDLPYLVVYTLALVVLATPTALLQLAVGQLSQQDSVGVWKAVPFFRGVGYLKLLTSLMSALSLVIYVALSFVMFMYTAVYSIPYFECPEELFVKVGDYNIVNSSSCLDETFLAPVTEKPEYFVAMFFIMFLIWMTFPIYLYSPVKSMKCSFYILAPVILLLALIIALFIGDSVERKCPLNDAEEWAVYSEPYVWYSAVSQALISSQISGGYLISAGYAVYSSVNVVWAALALVAGNVVAGWLGVIFWSSFGSEDERDSSVVAILIHIYKSSDSSNLSAAWSCLMFALLFLSGAITLITIFFPLYDRCRRTVDGQWRVLAMGVSLVGVLASLSVLAAGVDVMALLDGVAVPLLVNVTVAVEVSAFIFIYGWRTLVVDLEFLTCRSFPWVFVVGWWTTPALIVPLAFWWLVRVTGAGVAEGAQGVVITLYLTLTVLLTVFFLCAGFEVSKQDQYDLLSKINSSFKPSRNWGPKDPIMHYYWLVRSDNNRRGMLPRQGQTGWRIGQMSGGASFLNIPHAHVLGTTPLNNDKPRANSDDCFWIGRRRENLRASNMTVLRSRSRSLDWTQKINSNIRTHVVNPLDIHTPTDAVDNNNILINDKCLIRISK